MDRSSTTRTTRIVIWIIAIVMAIGAVGSYFLLIIQNDEAQNPKTPATTQEQEPVSIDQSAYKVQDKVTELQRTDLTVGTGTEAAADSLVRMHYKGTIAQTGAKFDSSYDRGEPLTCTLAGLIAGWQQGVPGMKVGGKRRLVIPAELAYGATERPGIPANSDLVFEVELLAVNPEGATDQCAQ